RALVGAARRRSAPGLAVGGPSGPGLALGCACGDPRPPRARSRAAGLRPELRAARFAGTPVSRGSARDAGGARAAPGRAREAALRRRAPAARAARLGRA